MSPTRLCAELEAVKRLPMKIRIKILEYLLDAPAVVSDNLPNASIASQLHHEMMPMFVHLEAANPRSNMMRRLIRAQRPWGLGQDLDVLLRDQSGVSRNELWFGPALDTLAVSSLRLPCHMDFGNQHVLQQQEYPLEKILTVENGFGLSLMNNLGPNPSPPFRPHYQRQFSHIPMDTPVDLGILPRLRHITFAFDAEIHETLRIGRARQGRREGLGEFVCQLGPDNTPMGVWFRPVAAKRFEDVEGTDISFWAQRRERCGHEPFSAIIHVNMVRDDESKKVAMKTNMYAEEWIQVVDGPRLEAGLMPVIRANWHRMRQRIGDATERVVRKGRRHCAADTYLYHTDTE